MVWIGYAILGIVLFIFLTYGERKYQFGKRENFVFSIIYLLVVAGIFSRFGVYSFNDNIFMIFISELFCQLIYISYFLEKDFFNKEDRYLIFYIGKIVVAFLINQELVNKVSDVFLSGEELKIIIWLVIIVYLYQLFKVRDNINSTSVKKDISISKENVVMSFAKLKLIYGEDISISDEDRKLVIYAIMIFNNYKRPKIFRKLDNILFKIDNKPRKLGIMQIMSKKYLNDYDSISSACKKVEKLYSKSNNSLEIINLYDKDNAKDIVYIYEELKKFRKL